MILLLDTNVILDIFLKREPFFADSYAALRKAASEGVECFLSASAATDIFYILRKSFQSADAARRVLNDLMRLAAFTDVLASDISAALVSEIKDFEDAVADSVAARIGAAAILTRNAKDYKGSCVPAISPTEFLKS